MKNAHDNIPTIFVIFGATGDLARRKLLPSVFDLFVQNDVPDQFYIIGFADTEYDNVSFRKYVYNILAQDKARGQKNIDKFISHIQYQKGLFGDAQAYLALAKQMVHIEAYVGQCMNKLFHLAVPPQFYKTLLTKLAQSGLTIPCSTETGWTRVLIEKPFGRDTETAQSLDRLLAKLFNEEQIFRIDHYLAKETVQNILTFRFSNALFEPLWNREHIERVEISLHETLDVSARGQFYDGVGTLRDVGQNHALQILSLTAMEHPVQLNANAIRRARAQVLQDLTIDHDHSLHAQYDGYRSTDGVASDSQTETFFRITGMIDNERWRDVPFVIEAGKALSEKETKITLFFKEIKPCFCVKRHAEHRHQNILTFRIQPEEGITMQFFAKKAGLTADIEQRTFDFNYRHKEEKEIDAYAKLLFDCIRGDQTLFASTDEVSASWRAIMPVLNAWHSDGQISQYAKGTASKDIL